MVVKPGMDYVEEVSGRCRPPAKVGQHDLPRHQVPGRPGHENGLGQHREGTGDCQGRHPLRPGQGLGHSCRHQVCGGHKLLIYCSR